MIFLILTQIYTDIKVFPSQIEQNASWPYNRKNRISKGSYESRFGCSFWSNNSLRLRETSIVESSDMIK